MDLFDVLKKKDCEICGKEVGMLGYKKLEGGVRLDPPWRGEPLGSRRMARKQRGKKLLKTGSMQPTE